jgi:hypothetical protein
MMLTKWDIDKDDPDQFRALQGSRTLFAQWVFEDEELNAYELSLPVEEQEELTAKLTTGHESAEQFEKLRLRSSFLYLHMDNAKISLSKLRMGYFYGVIDSYIF